jgi:hypothetical protein
MGGKPGHLRLHLEKGFSPCSTARLMYQKATSSTVRLPNGKAERYDIVNVDFRNKFHAIPAHTSMSVQKQGALVAFEKSRVTNISIHNSHGIQVGDHNTQNFVTALQQIIEQIEKSGGTPEEKSEAKSRLRKFLEHPLTTSIAGGAAGGLTELLK